jgi:hypothetical protein
MKKEKLFVGIFASLFIFFGLSVSAFAEEATSASPKMVTFTVTVGDLVCKDGKGAASVQFENTPPEGGYYEVTGKMIDVNKISLSRKVSLPSGEYFWNGALNGGYATGTVSSGQFIIKECATDVPATKNLSDKKPAVIASGEKDKATSGKEFEFLNLTAEEDAKLVSVNSVRSEDSSSGTQRKVIAVVLIIGIVAGAALWKKYGKKIRE